MSHKYVRPVRPFMPYLGGKKYLADRLVERIEAVPHETYAEVFVGAGGVFFRRRKIPAAEVINDLRGPTEPVTISDELAQRVLLLGRYRVSSFQGI